MSIDCSRANLKGVNKFLCFISSHRINSTSHPLGKLEFMSEEFTEQHVKSLISTIRSDFLDRFSKTEHFHSLQPNTNLRDSDPRTELQKLSQIIKAHATKLGIVFNPTKFEDNINAACKELQQFANAVFFLISLLPLFYKGKFPDYFIDELDTCVLGLFDGIGGMCDEIEKLLQDSSTVPSAGEITGEDADENADIRLISVGKMWSSCDSLSAIATQGSFGLLDSKIRVSIKLLNDTLLELEDWLVDPQLESDDPFGLDDSFSETESEDELKPPQEMIDFVKHWQTNLKLIKLLLSSFSKSISSKEYKNKDAHGPQLSKLNQMHKVVVERVDELISTTFMSGADFDPTEEEISEIVSSLNKTLKGIVQIIKTLNGTDSKKGKWIEVWEAKYFN